ncbi:Crossover junction endonuclease mus81 [Puccinia graminis f. sp. tritici]|uniref:Crossover junction endonuclease MUS81 n=1 Tax=Puccinia graminis f. sp. tritici TaxID=56615 RepID=A0A5B0PF36_PUCGR|nr:Crossover junction endonuclease mus81 [Puccinia graminis f. sp. tritici]KAA1123518.1 Crossover junction endonuclease mus81 [Puccinia graminis f. sp. tritici]
MWFGFLDAEVVRAVQWFGVMSKMNSRLYTKQACDTLSFNINDRDAFYNFQHEVVLDLIVKRKRLDDLCASIKDNRFEEQKARLKLSGLRDPIYLVKAYNTQSNLESYGQMIYTSKFETMLLNNFQLEATPDWKASVEFLVRRSEVLHDLHQEFEGKARGGTIAEMMVSANVKDEGKRRRKFRHSVMGMQVSDKTSQPARLPCAPYFPRLAVYTRKPNRRHRLGGALSRARQCI